MYTKIMLPNLIIIGAPKCGTSSLHHYLSQHPDIFMSSRKELNFFTQDGTWRKGLKWYKAQFPKDLPIRGETSPSYTDFPIQKDIPQRMHKIIPHAKLIYVVRDPIERIISHYMDDFRAFNSETRSLEEILRISENNRYYNMTRYYMQIEQYLQFFDRSQIFILNAADLLTNRKNTLKTIFKFLKVNWEFESKDFNQRLNVGSQKMKMARSKKPVRIVRYYFSGRPFAKILQSLTPARLRERVRKHYYQKIPVERVMLNPEMKKTAFSVLNDDLKKFEALSGISFTAQP